VAGALADDVELALERIGDRDAAPRPMKTWRITGSMPRTDSPSPVLSHRHVAPAEQHLALHP
jgi:hypothetical protein